MIASGSLGCRFYKIKKLKNLKSSYQINNHRLQESRLWFVQKIDSHNRLPWGLRESRIFWIKLLQSTKAVHHYVQSISRRLSNKWTEDQEDWKGISWLNWIDRQGTHKEGQVSAAGENSGRYEVQIERTYWYLGSRRKSWKLTSAFEWSVQLYDEGSEKAGGTQCLVCLYLFWQVIVSSC